MEREGKENVAWRRCAKSRIVGERDIKIRVDAKSETHLVNCKVASLASFSYRGRRFFPRPVLRLRPHPCCYNYYSSYLGRFALYLNLNTRASRVAAAFSSPPVASRSLLSSPRFLFSLGADGGQLATRCLVTPRRNCRPRENNAEVDTIT